MQKNIRCINPRASKQPLEKVAPNSNCLMVAIFYCYFAKFDIQVSKRETGHVL